MKQVDLLRDEIGKVAEVTKQHKTVSENVKISTIYLSKIRSGECCKIDTEDNIKLMREILNAYRKLGNIQLKNLENVL